MIYTLPELDPELEKEMIDAPYETKSDSFYFVGNKMVMHNKVSVCACLVSRVSACRWSECVCMCLLMSCLLVSVHVARLYVSVHVSCLLVAVSVLVCACVCPCTPVRLYMHTLCISCIEGNTVKWVHEEQD